MIKSLRIASIAFILSLLSSLYTPVFSQLHFYEAGSGETIIFVHGMQEDYSVFVPVVDALKGDLHAITYSRRYNYPDADSYQPAATFSPSTEAADLSKFLVKHDIEKAHIVGHSFGGLVAMSFAEENPDRVLSLTLSEPPVLQMPGCESWLERAQQNLIVKVRDAFATGDTTRIMGALFEFFAGSDIQDQVPPEVLGFLERNLEEVRAFVHSTDPFAHAQIDPQIPMMIISGGQTMLLLHCANQALREKYPGARHIHLEDASHEMWMTHTDELIGHLREFVLTE